MSFDGHPYSDPLEIALRRELQEGERVLWKGRPLPRIKWSGFALYFFAIPWTAFSLFWTIMAATGIGAMEAEGPGLIAWAFPLFGLPFILVGLAMLSPPFLPLFFARKTLYAITDKRLIELRLGHRLTTKSIDADRLGPIERSEGRDGAGSLKIAIGTRYDSDGDPHTDHFELGEIDGVMNAESVIRQMTDGLRAVPDPRPSS